MNELYKIIPVKASLTNNKIDTIVSLADNMVDTSADMVTTIRHSAVADYLMLINKPQINSVELVGNKELPEIGVDNISNMELEQILQ